MFLFSIIIKIDSLFVHYLLLFAKKHCTSLIDKPKKGFHENNCGEKVIQLKVATANTALAGTTTAGYPAAGKGSADVPVTQIIIIRM